MEMLLILAVFIGYAALIYHKFKINSAFIPVTIITSITGIVYIFGLANQLELSVQIINIAGLLLFIYFIVQALRKNFSMKFFLCPAIIFFLIGALYFGFLLKDLSYFHYDNFTHFGKIVKEMFYFDSLPNMNTTITFQNYPPATAIFIYYFCKIIGYSEGHALVAQAILVISILATFLWKDNFKKVFFNFLSFTIIFITISMLSFDDTTLHIYNLLVDGILGFLASASIIVTYYYRNDIKKNVFVNLPLLSFLVLTKDSGKLFFFICILFVLFSNTQLKAFKKNIKELKIILPLIILLVWVPLLFSSSWANYVKKAYPSTAYESNKFAISKSKLKETYNSHSHEFVKTLPAKFINRVFDIHSINTQLLISVNAISILISIIYYIFLKKRASLQLKALALSNCMLVAYLIGEFLMYLLIMPEAEAVNLASFDRYFCSAIILFASTQLICGINSINKLLEHITTANNTNKRKPLFEKSLLLLICCIIILPNFYIVRTGMKQLFIRPNEQEFRRIDVKKACEKVKNYLGRDESILIYNGDKDNTTGFYLALGKYEMLTNDLNVIDVNLINSDKKKFLDFLAKRNYIIMAENDEIFWNELNNNNIKATNEKDGILYKIIHENGQIRIEKVA
jgi:hypothetical protein